MAAILHTPVQGVLTIISPVDGVLTPTGEVHTHVFKVPGVAGDCHGRGLSLLVGGVHAAAGGGGELFVVDLSGGGMGPIRLQRDLLLTLDPDGGTGASVVGQRVNLHATVEHPEWAAQLVICDDGTIGPARNPANPQCTGLCLGVEPGNLGGGVIMVSRDDAARKLIFGGPIMEAIGLMAVAAKASVPPCVPGTNKSLLLLKSPPCEWLGPGLKALVLLGGVHEHVFSHAGEELNGRHVVLRVGVAKDAAEWLLDGGDGGGGGGGPLAVRLASDPAISLDAAGGTASCTKSTKVNLHATVEHPEWAQQWRLTDGMLSPFSPANDLCPNLCLGVERAAGAHEVVLVERGSANALVFGSAEEMEGHLQGLEEERQMELAVVDSMRDEAHARCNSEMKARLVQDGYV
jgi:hypothetical protein